ncbi:MAG: hypothetical protein Q9219_001672 [cf. Caloplaca sp. 3 TL-2023]
MADSPAPIVPNPQAQVEHNRREKQLQDRRDTHEKEQGQRRTSQPTDKNIPDGIDHFIVGDGVQQYKRIRDLERKLDAIMMRKRLDLQDTRQGASRRYKTMRIWLSNTADFQSWQNRGEDQEMYDFSGTSEGLYRMKIEGRLLDDKEDEFLDGDDDSDDDEEMKEGAAADQVDQPTNRPTLPIRQRPKTRLSHFFTKITIEFDRNKTLQPEEATQIEWKRPSYSPNAMAYPDGADFDSLEFERKSDQDINCTINFYRDDDRHLLSDDLAALLDVRESDRRSVLIGIYDYIKAMNLQQDDEKRAIQCDERLRKIFRCDTFFLPNMHYLLANNHHLLPLPPISVPYTIRCDPSFNQDSEPVPATIYDLTLVITPPFQELPLPSTDQLTAISQYDKHLALVVQAIQHSKSKHAFMAEFERDPVGFLKRWMASQRRDLEVITGDGVGMGRGDWGTSDGVGVGMEWRRGGIWGREEVRESVRLMK